MTKVSCDKKENSTPVKGKPIKSKVGTPGQSNRPIRLSRNKGKTYLLLHALFIQQVPKQFCLSLLFFFQIK